MITGHNLVGGVWESNSNATTYKTINPKTEEILPSCFDAANASQIETAVEAAAGAFETFAATSFKTRITFLKAIQKEIKANSVEILSVFQLESALPEGRANGELQRTLDQIERFVELLEEGSFIQATLNTNGLDLRKMLYPIGPIVVFGASNFPLAFSTAGGDTISALAAGCPVVVKAHPYHAGTSELVAQAIHLAIKKSKVPTEAFSHLGGQSHELGMSLVSHPLVKGVGFTGSFTGGKSLFDLVQQREEPIPFFAEMGSVNPIFILENKVKKDSILPTALASSITLGTGQFCTKPGLIVICDSDPETEFAIHLGEAMDSLELEPMVHSKINKKYKQELNRLKNLKDKIHTHLCSNSVAALGLVSAKYFIETPNLSEEVFGPYSLIVHCQNMDEMLKVASCLSGQLTATLLSTQEDEQALRVLKPIIQSKAGRILFDGVPTGVAVNQAMQHGGPFPASTDSRFTSVGSDAIYRWLRPLSFQDCPNALLPEALQNENPFELQRRVNGVMTNTRL